MKGLNVKLFNRLEDLEYAEFAVFVGYDPKEHDAAEVLAHSIHRHNRDVVVVPIVYHELKAHGIYTRDIDSRGSTQFSMSRFVAPKLARTFGSNRLKKCIFMDCDMLVTRAFDYDVVESNGFAVNVCKHNYVPLTEYKMDEKKQFSYARKNWSSFVVYDVWNPALQPLMNDDYLNNASPAELHRFMWIDNSEIGSIPLKWNYLVGETSYDESSSGVYYKKYGLEKDQLPANIHYTLGTPDLPLYNDCKYSELWFDEYYLLHGKQHHSR